jgi:activating signal cointegrator 1
VRKIIPPDEMPVISLHQPAAMMLLGPKLHETRSYAYAYGSGDLAIHATRNTTKSDKSKMLLEPWRTALMRMLGKTSGYVFWDDLPRGAIIGVVHVDYSRPITEELRRQQTPEELAFGEWGEGRWVWHCSNKRRLRDPIFVKGRESYWRYNRAAIMSRIG